MDLMDEIVERVGRIEKELKVAPSEGGSDKIANRTFDKEMEGNPQEKRDKAHIIGDIAKKVELLERELRDIIVEKRDKSVRDKFESRIEHIEMEMSRNASQEKRDKFALMTVLDKIANRLNRMEGQLSDAPSEKGEKGVVDEIATRVEHIERKIEEDIPQEKKFKALLMSVLDEISTRVERMEIEMKNGQIETKDKLQLMASEVAENRQDRIQRDSEEVPVIAKPKDISEEFTNRVKHVEGTIRKIASVDKKENDISVLGEIAKRVEHIERDIRTLLLEKGDKSAVDEIANRVEHIGSETNDAQSKKPSRLLTSALDETANRAELVEHEVRAVQSKKGDKCTIEEIAYQVGRMEKDMMGVMEELANRVERMENEMRDAFYMKAEETPATSAVEDITDRLERMEGEMKSLVDKTTTHVQRMERALNVNTSNERKDHISLLSVMDVMDEIAHRVERMESEISMMK